MTAQAKPDTYVTDPGRLWARIETTYSEAVASGAATSIENQPQIVHSEQSSIPFVLRVSAALQKKAEPSKGTGHASKPKDPFLPYDENLWVAHLSATHTLLLNKFNLVARHTLVVTREFESQESPLSAQDMAATWTAMQAYPQGGLAYYNRGPVSGASQPHKHLQVVPLPVSEDLKHPVPVGAVVQAALDTAAPPAGSGAAADAHMPNTASSVQAADASNLEQLPGSGAAVQPGSASAGPGGSGAPGSSADVVEVRELPFQAFACRVDTSMSGAKLADLAAALAASAHLPDPASLNLLLTATWMLLVPRRADGDGVVSLNAMGFAGTFLVRGQQELEHVQRKDPMAILAELGVPW